MRDGGASCRTAKHQIVVLRAVTVTSQPTQLMDQRGVETDQVSQIHLRQEQVQIPVGLEVRMAKAAVFAQHIMVGIDDTCRCGHMARDHRSQCIRLQQVIMVEEGDPAPLGQCYRSVGRGRNALPFA